MPPRILGVSYFILLTISRFAFAVPPQHFEPLKDTLQKYNIFQMPEAAQYPGVPAVGLLSLQEYRQFDTGHNRILHRIIKILTPSGKEYATVKIGCLGSCRIDGRTIKADGKMIPLPSRDLVRPEKLSDYTAPYHYAQFALPQVEPGDIIEYMATIEHSAPFFADDFRFSDPYPVLKGVLILTHSQDYSYSYVRYSPAGSKPIEVLRDTFQEPPVHYIRTTFVAENIRAFVEEPRSGMTKQNQPGVRLFLDSRYGAQIEAFHDWSKYGEFIAKFAKITILIGGPVKKFVEEIAGKQKDPASIVASVYRASQRKIHIVDRSLFVTGFEFQKPDDVLQKQKASPHDFALFLASCFKHLKWSSDLILANSYNQPEASSTMAFPLDLDLVFLKVKTPAGEFLLDCNGNGRLPNTLPSEAMNRFAIGIPLSYDFQNARVTPILIRMPQQAGNVSRLEIEAVPNGTNWSLQFRWFLGGEFQTGLARLQSEISAAEMLANITSFLRSRLNVEEIRDIRYDFGANGLELIGSAVVKKRRVSPDIELLQNSLWVSGFDVGKYLLENRESSLLLPVIGEISSIIKIRLDPQWTGIMPSSYQTECGQATYSLQFQKEPNEIRVDEKLIIVNLAVKKADFLKFGEFLDQYQLHHYWSILLSQGKIADQSVMTFQKRRMQ
jgi:hypothetical protein